MRNFDRHGTKSAANTLKVEIERGGFRRRRGVSAVSSGLVSEMDFDKKPGARDGKPKKSTRRGGPPGLSKPHEVIELRTDMNDMMPPRGFGTRKGREELDEETGLRAGVIYSVNKGKRWELVEQLREQTEEDKKAARKPRSKSDGEEEDEKDQRGHVLLVEAVDDGRERRAIKNQMTPVRADARKYKEKQEEAAKEEEKEEQTEMIKSRKGPKPKKNQPKCKSKSDDEGSAYDPQRVFVVLHDPSQGEMRCKKNLSRDGKGAMGCKCSACRGWVAEVSRKEKKEQLLRGQGLK